MQQRMKIYIRKPNRRQAGFSLLEMGIAVTLMAMIFIGTMTMYLSMARTTMRSQSEVYSSAAAANALQYMIQQSREAYDFKLPLEYSVINGTPAAGTQFTVANYPDQFQGTAAVACVSPNSNSNYDSNYQAKYKVNGNWVIINTAVVLFMPKTVSGNISVLKSDGVSTYTYTPGGGVDNTMYDRTQGAPGNAILYYRSDAGGVPDPLDGQYLWEYSLWDSGATINKKLVQLFDTQATANAVPNAVQFDRPTALPFQLEMKIICGNYSPINGVQTNEATNGSDATALTGKCVLMRDHVTLPDVLDGTGNSTVPTDSKFYPSGT
jgi:type II secretory pathway pseudopilin PulG